MWSGVKQWEALCKGIILYTKYNETRDLSDPSMLQLWRGVQLGGWGHGAWPLGVRGTELDRNGSKIIPGMNSLV